MILASKSCINSCHVTTPDNHKFRPFYYYVTIGEYMGSGSHIDPVDLSTYL